MSNASDFIINKKGVLTKYVGSDRDVAIPMGVSVIGSDNSQWRDRSRVGSI